MESESNGKAVEVAINGATNNGTLSDGKDRGNSLTTLEGEPQKLPYPKSVFFIISNEFCERFNYLGMRTILVLYLTEKLMFDDDTSTVLYHAFSTMVYFTCIFGAILSDGFLGKFRTILYLSFVYAFGSSIIAIGAIPTLNLPAKVTTCLGLLFIAIGSGGIKPCVSAFGGDQFKLPAQLAQMATFFSVFYFAINAGSLISTFITPILRQDVHCFGDTDCYSLAFGVPGVLMILSIIFFVCGKPLYKIIAPEGNMVSEVIKCMKNAIVTKRQEKKTNPREHWLDYSEEKYGKRMVADIKVLLKVLVLLIPMPLFWTLFDQQGSRWTFQATRMTGDIGFYNIKPDQMQVVNPLLILVLIPLFDSFVYPLLAKIGIRRPLQKLTIGGLLAGFAFLLSGIVELQLEKTYPVLPSENQAQLRFINGLPCNFTVNTNVPWNEQYKLNQFSMYEDKYIYTQLVTSGEYALISNDTNCPERIRGRVSFKSNTATTVFISGHDIERNDTYVDSPQKARTPMLRVLFSSLGEKPFREVKIVTPSNYNRVAFTGNSTYRELFPISSGVHEVYIDGQTYKTITLKDGSVSTLIVLETPNAQTKFQVHVVEITQPNSVSILWLLPQYIVMTMGEVMFSVTSLDFSYTQAPESLKSVLQAAWLLTVAFGNVIVMIIAGASLFESQANEFFLFAGLMVVDMFVFMILAKNYKSVPAVSKDVESEFDKRLSLISARLSINNGTTSTAPTAESSTTAGVSSSDRKY